MTRGPALVLCAASLALSCSACGEPLGADAAPPITRTTDAAGPSRDAEVPSTPASFVADAASDASGAELGDGGEDGGDAAAVVPPECPEGMAKSGRSCIDRYEAHLVTADEDGGLSPFPHVDRPLRGVRYASRSLPGVFPQGYINRIEAKAACEASGKRLCSMREWLRACEGKRGTTFPYGGRGVPGRCNSGKQHLLALKYGLDPRKWKYDEQFNDPLLDAEPGFLARSGEYEGCAGEEGIYDLVGNLHEWVSDTIDQDFVDRFEAEEVERHKQPWKEGNGVFMGGFFSTTDQHGAGCTFTTIAHEPSYHDYSIGFRCCAPARVDGPPRAMPRKKRDAGVPK